ncbi:coxsackievirus and adenovirus receptor-like [Maylandia zebra]|uniref:coxsackievirus and adenovirus receptor-like n=1 Tax=Maylandia zebra TaxID=106582 RepID=UPI00403D4C61
MSASLCSTLLFVGVFVFVSADQKIITAESGQNVTLPCRAPNNNIILGVEWNRADLETQYVLFYRDNLFDPDEQHPSSKDRVGLQDRQMKDGDVSLILKNVTINDTGTYECRVKTEKKCRENQSNVIKEPILNENAFSSITLIVVPPGQTGGDTEDGGKEDGGKEDGGKEDGSVGMIVGLTVPALLLFTGVVGFLIYRKHKRQSQGPY